MALAPVLWLCAKATNRTTRTRHSTPSAAAQAGMPAASSARAHGAVGFGALHEVRDDRRAPAAGPSAPPWQFRSLECRRSPRASRAAPPDRAATRHATARNRPPRPSASAPWPRLSRPEASMEVCFRLRAAARIVVVLAMPTRRTPGRSASSTVSMPLSALDQIGALDDEIVRPERDPALSLLVHRHEGDVDLARFHRVGQEARVRGQHERDRHPKLRAQRARPDPRSRRGVGRQHP